MLKRGRTFQATMESQLKSHKSDYDYVNPFTLMMEAAKQHPCRQQPGDGDCSAGRALADQHTIPCTHCGAQLMHMQMQQCNGCKQVYCASCSVADYEEREDRCFCLDCRGQGGALQEEEDLLTGSCYSPWRAAHTTSAAAAAEAGSGSPPWMRRGRSILAQACSAAAAQPLSPLPLVLPGFSPESTQTCGLGVQGGGAPWAWGEQQQQQQQQLQHS